MLIGYCHFLQIISLKNHLHVERNILRVRSCAAKYNFSDSYQFWFSDQVLRCAARSNQQS